MNIESTWWEYTKEYVYGTRENVFNKEKLINYFYENQIIERKQKELENEGLEIVVGPCFVTDNKSVKVGFCVRNKQK
ncbi:MAG: hypothetical protein Q4G05_06570 [Clostridia bacterium]|nr:hypothetical protein [Clostridia bacterium]